jgi:hypothetical protein
MQKGMTSVSNISGYEHVIVLTNLPDPRNPSDSKSRLKDTSKVDIDSDSETNTLLSVNDDCLISLGIEYKEHSVELSESG